jgi:molybdopterin converting factor small subunit
MPVTIRFFAAAADAAGRAEETLVLPSGTRVGDVERALVDRHGAPLAEVLAPSAFLVGESLTRDRSLPLPRDADGGASVDVLPPFAGG